ncbi:hypothetical protein FRB96_008574 [Tulasnella sp. 330]|nr:hypothetical protein FRB96_008574 [Tulasnella sp. 330]
MVGPSGGPGSGGVTPGVFASPPPAANHGTGSVTGSHTPPPFNPYVIPTLAPRMMSMNPDADQQTNVMSELRSPHNPYGGSLSPAPMYQPRPQPLPPNWRESMASSGTYVNDSMGSRGMGGEGMGAYDTSMLSQLDGAGMPMRSPTFRTVAELPEKR